MWLWKKLTKGAGEAEKEQPKEERRRTSKDDTQTKIRRHSVSGLAGGHNGRTKRSQSVVGEVDGRNPHPHQQPATHNTPVPVPVHAARTTNHYSVTPMGSYASYNSQDAWSTEDDAVVEEGQPYEVLALHDYQARIGGELSFRKDEHLEVLNDSLEDWLHARNPATGLEGFIPASYVAKLRSIQAEPWYFGNITRGECERRLLHALNDHGAFMVRNSESRKDEYSLSVRSLDKVVHYRVRSDDQGGCFIARKNSFPSLHALVQFYSAEKDRGLCTRLEKPCVKLDTPDTPGLSYTTRDAWEIPHDQIELRRRLGSGHFGEVWEGRWNKTVPVAVKTLKPGRMNPQEFLAEAKVMKNLRHPKLIQLYAVATQQQPIYIITELMVNGSLLDYLRGRGHGLPFLEQVYVGSQVAAGMEYLESKNFIHRDLAARNVLVGDDNTVKVADFGLSRLVKDDEYNAAAGARFPIKWTAPEALSHNRFSSKSDVWSFGVLLYEIVTKGAVPYPGMNNREVADEVEKGYRMSQPANCPLQLYNLMLECWARNPDNRPPFEHIHHYLDQFFTLDDDYREC